MWRRVKKVYRKSGRTEKLFLLLFTLYAALYLASASTDLLLFALYITGALLAIRLARPMMRKLIWRLRNRLIVSYLFIAVVPIVLILVLVASGAYALTGQIAVHLVNSELERRTATLNRLARIFVNTMPENRLRMWQRLAFSTRDYFPQSELLVRDAAEFRYPQESTLPSPPKDWKNATGVVVKDRHLFAWSHVIEGAKEATLISPLTGDFLAGLVPELGDVSFLDYSEKTRKSRVPPKHNRFDFEVTWIYPVAVAFWDSPGKVDNGVLMVHTRPSAVLRIVFGQKPDWGQGVLLISLLISALFLIVELISLVIGVSITRTITRAVHGLYQGTQKIKEGDFSHRIEVRGNDQVSELAASFNHMTENLERLIVVEKERERLQSELKIAREVQAQLFPKNAPTLKTLEVTGICNPARMVSGDYYDFLCLQDSILALAIGDVAGKGISAALLMASIQSIMRAQLTAGIPTAAVAGGAGNGSSSLSTSYVVSQLNKQLFANTSPEKYATFCFGLYDEQSSVLTYTNAGHLPPILLRGGATELLEVTGTVVGAFPKSQYMEKSLRLLSGDLLLAYTDGITEPENEYGEEFGEQRLMDLVMKHAASGSTEIISRIMEAVRQWTASSEQYDDMTLLVLRRL